MSVARIACVATWACLLSVAALAQGITLPAVGRVELDNGVVIVLLEKRDVPLIGLEVVIRGGADLFREQVARYGDVTEMSITDPRFRP